MNNHNISRCTIIILFCVLAASGCSSVRMPLHHNDPLKIEFMPDKQVRFYQPHISQEEKWIIISGTLEGSHFKSKLFGHIDIASIGSEEKIPSFQSVKIFRKLFTRRSDKYSYTAKIPLTSSFNTDKKVIIAFHQSKLPEAFDCGDNLAVPKI